MYFFLGKQNKMDKSIFCHLIIRISDYFSLRESGIICEVCFSDRVHSSPKLYSLSFQEGQPFVVKSFSAFFAISVGCSPGVMSFLPTFETRLKKSTFPLRSLFKKLFAQKFLSVYLSKDIQTSLLFRRRFLHFHIYKKRGSLSTPPHAPLFYRYSTTRSAFITSVIPFASYTKFCFASCSKPSKFAPVRRTAIFVAASLLRSSNKRALFSDI